MHTWFWRAILAASFGVLALLGWMMHVQSSEAALDVPQILVYQGRLTDDDRITVDDGSYTMFFGIYNASSGGTCLWSAGDGDADTGTIDCSSNTPDNSISVTVTDGIFTVLLGDTSDSQNALPDELFDDNGSTLYLGVRISPDASELSPRRRIGASAFALQAGDSDLLDDLDTANGGCTSACVPVTDSNGNIIFTGSPQSSSASGASVYINPDTATSDEKLFGVADAGNARFTVDKEGDTSVGGHLAVAQASLNPNTSLDVVDNYDTSIAGSLRGIGSYVTYSGDLVADTGYGITSTVVVTDTGATDRLGSAASFSAEDNYGGDGTTSAWRLYNGSLSATNGTITDAYGVDVSLVTSSSGTITTARAVRGEVEHTAGTITTGYGGYFDTTGTMTTSYGVYGEGGATATTNYGGYFKADNGTTDYAIYTAEGRVHIDGDSSASTPNEATGDGTLFVAGTVETDSAIFVDGTVGFAASRNAETSLHIEPGTFSGTHADEDDIGTFTNVASTATGSGGTYELIGEKREITYSGTGTNTTVYGEENTVYVEGSVSRESYGQYVDVLSRGTASGVTNYGFFGRAGNEASSATTATAYGVYGETYETAGTLTTGYGGFFKAADATTNYGIFVGASGGTTDYAIYASEGYVHIEGDGTATTPTIAGSDGSLYVLDDIETDADLTVAGAVGIGDTPPTDAKLRVSDTFSSGSAEYGYRGVFDATSAQSHTGFQTVLDIDGALNTGGRINGLVSRVDVLGGAANDAEEINAIYSIGNHTGTGTTTAWYGLRNYQELDSTGAVTTAYGVDSETVVSNASGTITTGYGGRFRVNEDSGTITNAYGVFAQAIGTTNSYSIYGAEGYVHIEGDQSVTTPTFNTVGADGTVFIYDDTEIFDGSLCVGDGGADNCSDAAGTDGVIYSVNTSVTQHDLAEMFPSQQFLTAGEIVSIDQDTYEHVERTVGDEIIIGAISTAPGLTLGWETEEDGYYPVALTGRAPVKVNGEGGPIAIGDRIAQSSVAGVGKKADGPSEIVGIAMEAFDGNGSGAVLTFIQPHYWNGVDEASVTEEEPEPEVDPSGQFAVDGNSMRNIAYLEGYVWNISMDGVFTTDGAYRVEIRGNNRRDTITYSTLSSEQFVTLAGTTKISGRKADIDFGRLAPDFFNVIEQDTPIMVTATMSNGSGQVYVREKSTNGFEIWRDGGDGDEVDWIVYAYRKGAAPEELEPVEEEASETDEVAEETAPDEESTDETSEEPSEDEVVDEEPAEETPVEDVEESAEEPLDESTDVETEEETAEESSESEAPVEELAPEQEEEEAEEPEIPVEEEPAEDEPVDTPVEEPTEESAE